MDRCLCGLCSVKSLVSVKTGSCLCPAAVSLSHVLSDEPRPSSALDELSYCTLAMAAGDECGGGGCCCCVLSFVFHLGTWDIGLIPEGCWGEVWEGSSAETEHLCLESWVPSLEVRSQQGCHQRP